MIKNILKRREKSNTHLTHICRHRWSNKSSMKIDKNRSSQPWKPQCWLKAPSSFIFIELFLFQRCLQTWVRWVSLSSLLFKIFLSFYFSGFSFFVLTYSFYITVTEMDYYQKYLYKNSSLGEWTYFSGLRQRELCLKLWRWHQLGEAVQRSSGATPGSLWSSRCSKSCSLRRSLQRRHVLLSRQCLSTWVTFPQRDLALGMSTQTRSLTDLSNTWVCNLIFTI